MQDERIERIILLAISDSVCNFQCPYCYLSVRGGFIRSPLLPLTRSIEEIQTAFSTNRVGRCYINICAGGETLARKELLPYIRTLLELGHIVEIVTNGTLVDRFKEMATWGSALLSRLVLKCSLHFLELKNKGLLETFASNIKMMSGLGTSFTIELVGADIYLPHKAEIAAYCLKHFGAKPHVTIARDDRTAGIDYYTSLTESEYEREWADFDSFMFDYKTKIYHERKKRFCYAGARSLYVNFFSGETNRCYASGPTFNFYDLSVEPRNIRPVGKSCPLAYCYNGHALYAFGLCPAFSKAHFGNYLMIRDRACNDGTHWVKEPVASLFAEGLQISSNKLFEFVFSIFAQLKRMAMAALRPIKHLANKLDHPSKQ